MPRLGNLEETRILHAQSVRRFGPLIAVLGFALCAAACSAPPIDAVSAPSAALTDKASIARGAELASIGNCAGCHTTTEGRPFAGGLPLQTPFGVIYTTNITPDPRTGIGQWSRAAFVRAMREGVARDGTRLYPAFPYDHFTKTSDADLDALYAYVMTRDPVDVENHENNLHFPFTIRPLMAVWNAMFLDKKPFAADSAQTAEWNRGAYLVDSLGHCAACHSPRNVAGAEKASQGLSGASIDGWYAPALNDKSPSPISWTVDNLTSYLRTGLADNHAMAGGPMQGVVQELAKVDEKDVRAIATYVVSQMGAPTPDDEARARSSAQLASAGPLAAQPSKAGSSADDARLQLGATVYRDTCSSCHDLGRQTSSNGALQLPLAVAIHEPRPDSLIRIVTDGIKPVMGEHGRWMPDYGNSLTDDQIAALAAWLRQTAAPDAAPWENLAKSVREARQP